MEWATIAETDQGRRPKHIRQPGGFRDKGLAKPEICDRMRERYGNFVHILFHIE